MAFIALPYGLNCYDREEITVSTTKQGLTTAKIFPSGGQAKGGLITIHDQDVRICFMGTDPTSTLGHRVAAGDAVWVWGADVLKTLEIIREDGSDAEVEVSYWR